MENSAAAWFRIVEAQFILRSITSSDTKYYNALALLPGSVVALIPESAHEGANYETLKKAVISSFEKSKPEILDKLLSSTKLTGRPSIFMQEIINLAAPIGVGQDMIRHKFIQALPQSISAVIASQTTLDLQSLAKLADDLLPYLNNHNASINNVTNDKKRYDEQPAYSQQGLRPYSKDQRPKICRSHIFFADKAKYCKPWCRWPNKGNITMQPNSRPSSPAPSPNRLGF